MPYPEPSGGFEPNGRSFRSEAGTVSLSKGVYKGRPHTIQHLFSHIKALQR